jgi:tripartite-type tricarboxylate transporter receptor subunit TctC
VLSGETQVSFVGVGSAAGALKSDKVRVLAITSSQRSSLFPDLPTVEESGVPGYETTSWVGLFGPAKLPPEIAARLTTEVRRALSAPDTRSTLRRSFLEPAGTTGEELAKVMRADTEKWTRLARERNIKVAD